MQSCMAKLAVACKKAKDYDAILLFLSTIMCPEAMEKGFKYVNCLANCAADKECSDLVGALYAGMLQCQSLGDSGDSEHQQCMKGLGSDHGEIQTKVHNCKDCDVLKNAWDAIFGGQKGNGCKTLNNVAKAGGRSPKKELPGLAASFATKAPACGGENNPCDAKKSTAAGMSWMLALVAGVLSSL